MSGARADGDTGGDLENGTEELPRPPISKNKRAENIVHEGRRIYSIEEADRLNKEISDGFRRSRQFTKNLSIALIFLVGLRPQRIYNIEEVIEQTIDLKYCHYNPGYFGQK